jgi:hypothetical protein
VPPKPHAKGEELVLDPTQELRTQVGKHLVRRHRHNDDRPVFDLVAREVMTDVNVL